MISHNLVAKKEINAKDILEIIEVDLINREDNLFDRLKSLLNEFWILSFNKKVDKNDQLLLKIPNFLKNIKGNPKNEYYFKHNFKDNLSHFIKDEENKKIIEEKIRNVYYGTMENKGAIEGAIKLFDKTPLQFINEIMNSNEEKKEFFDEDKEMIIKEIIVQKCRIIYWVLNLTKGEEIPNIKKYILVNSQNDDYFTLKNVDAFINEVIKIKGYEDLKLELTDNENLMIGKRLEILERLATDPMKYLSEIKERKPRSSND